VHPRRGPRRSGHLDVDELALARLLWRAHAHVAHDLPTGGEGARTCRPGITLWRHPPVTVRNVDQRWWTSDLHLGHAGILVHTKRPYRHVDDMNVDLIERWSEVVKPSDEVYILRDLAMGPIAEMLALMKLFHGTRLLVQGTTTSVGTGCAGGGTASMSGAARTRLQV